MYTCGTEALLYVREFFYKTFSKFQLLMTENQTIRATECIVFN